MSYVLVVKLFVSYSQENTALKGWIDEMLEQLRDSLASEVRLEILQDANIKGGEEWEKKILGWVDDCDIAMLLLSSKYFSSEFVREKELERLKERVGEENPPEIYPVLLEVCKDDIPGWIKKLQIRPGPDKPLAHMDSEARKVALDQMKRDLSDTIDKLPQSDDDSSSNRSNRSNRSDEDDDFGSIDIDVTLGHRDGDLYLGEMRISYPDEERPSPVIAFETRFDYGSKAERRHGSDYGTYIGKQLFPDYPGIMEGSEIHSGYGSSGSDQRTPASILDQALKDSKKRNASLRLRVAISSNARELNRLPWEQICDPVTEVPLATHHCVHFSRTIVGYNENWREVHLRRAPEKNEAIKVSIFVPRRADVLNHKGEPIGQGDPHYQLSYVKQCLADSAQTFLWDTIIGNFNELFDYLDTNFVDVLMLVVAKSKDEDGRPRLVFTSADGTATLYRYEEIARAFHKLHEPPRLVVLSTPCVDGSGEIKSDCAIFGIQDFAPAIAEAGVPAVITFQAATRPENWRVFLVELFSQLYRCKRIDRVVSLARQKIAGATEAGDDWWRPVLIGRLRNSRIWYRPGFTDLDSNACQQILSALDDSLKRGDLLPIIGPGIIHDIAGSRRKIARRWAYDFGFPMEHHNRMNLPQVAQYLQIQSGRPELQRQLVATLESLICDRYREDLAGLIEKRPDNAHSDEMSIWLDDLFRTVNVEQRKRNAEYEPHGLLAKLNVPVYLTTNLSSILEQALEEVGKRPRTLTFRELAERERHGTDTEDFDEPTRDDPWVIHLFGTLKNLSEAALTEDDYFEFLSDFASTSHQEVIVSVKEKLVNSSLLFLGFRIHHWTFRTLFRSIHRIEGAEKQNSYQHVAVQFDPDDDQMTNPKGAKNYLRLLFDQDDVNVYWGGSEDFLRELIFFTPPAL